MKGNDAERRMLANEAVFRRRNREVQKGLEEFHAAAEAEGHEELVSPLNIKLQFYCECADEDCQERIALRAQTYKNIHTNDRRFIVRPTHEVSTIEKVVRKTTAYTVVEKFLQPPKHPVTLQPTPIDNA